MNSKPSQKQNTIGSIGKIDKNNQIAKNIFQTGGLTVYSPFPLYEGQKQFIAYIIQCLKAKKNGLVQSPTGTGKTLSLLCSTLSWVYNQQKLGGKGVRIIYTSRTHAQLKQVVQQLVKTGFNAKIAILGSRDHTCINEDLSRLTGQGKQLQCRIRVMRKNNMFCKYFHHKDYYQNMKNIGTIADLQEIKHKGKQQGYCPFFYQKTAKNTANLILMPYNYLLDEKSMQETNLLIQNSIVIFDEAHNVPNACESSKQFRITSNNLSRSMDHLGKMRLNKLQQNKTSTGKQKNKSEDIEQITSTINELEMHASFVSNFYSNLKKMDIPYEDGGRILEMHQFLKRMDKWTSDSQFGMLRNKLAELNKSAANIRADILVKPYWALETWLNFLLRLEDLYKNDRESDQKDYYYKCQVVADGSQIQVNLLCLDPKVSFHRITQMKPLSIILTSGTLNPIASIPIQLQTQFNKPFACSHIMTKQQVNGCILTQGPNKVKLNFSYQNRSDPLLYKDLGLAIVEIATKTPNGIIVFVPSYDVLYHMRQHFFSQGILNMLYAQKNLFFQVKNSPQFKQVLDNYLAEAVKKKGALLFALARGKIAEGLDFSNQKCRAVVLVGIPYLAYKDVKVKSKRQYLDQKNKKTKSMNGNQWYICEAIRCINQTIGRIIRNKDDYGSIYLLDQRFKKAQTFEHISSWARQCLSTVDDFDQFKFKVSAFNKYFKDKCKQQQQIQYFFTSHLGTKLSNKIVPTATNVKTSISVNKNTGQSKAVNPQTQLQALKNELLGKSKQEKQPQKQEITRQRIIFNAKPTKKLPIQAKQCPVCRLERRLIKNTECIHQICEQCWDIWLKKDLRCPICRVRVREKYLIKS